MPNIFTSFFGTVKDIAGTFEEPIDKVGAAIGLADSNVNSVGEVIKPNGLAVVNTVFQTAAVYTSAVPVVGAISNLLAAATVELKMEKDKAEGNKVELADKLALDANLGTASANALIFAEGLGLVAGGVAVGPEVALASVVVGGVAFVLDTVGLFSSSEEKGETEGQKKEQKELATVQRKFDKGASDILEVLSTQSALADAEQQRIQCLAEWRSARLRLLTSVGGLGLREID